MKLYVGTYKKYNNGNLFGAWLDCADYSDKEDFLEACLELHKDEEDPELMFQDFDSEGTPEEFYSECNINDALWEYLALDEDQRECIEVALDNNLIDLNKNDLSCVADNFIVHSSKDDIIENWLEYNEVPENIRFYIDEELLWRDIEIDGSYYEHNGKIYEYTN